MSGPPADLLYDAVVIGGGHNGLVAAAYLGKAGLKVAVFERRAALGGAASTEEIFPGFRADLGSFDAGRLMKQVISDLGLEGFDLKLVGPPVLAYAPQSAGPALALWREVDKTQAEIARFSKQDAERYPDFAQQMVRKAHFLQDLWTLAPPNLPDLDVRELLPWLGAGRRLRGMGKREMMELLRVLPMPISDYLDEWFESPLVKGILGGPGLLGVSQGPRSPGTMLNLLYATLGAQAGHTRSCHYVHAGLGQLAQALASAGQARGVEIYTGCEVQSIQIEAGRAAGVVLADGRRVGARALLSSAPPRHTFFDLVGTEALEVRFVREVKNIRYQGSLTRMILALDGLPRFRSASARESGIKEGTLLSGRIVICPDLDYLERAYDQAKYGAFSRQPYLEMSIPTLLDASLAPPGKHLLLINVQYTPYHLADGDWDQRRNELGEIVLGILEDLAPGLSNLILHQEILTPLDLERRLGLPEGCIYHGQMSLDQQLFMRPVPGFGGYRTPIDGLFLCGVGAHPGAGVTGAPGHNAAREVIKVLGSNR